jgi:hypothetical protein
LAKHGNNPQAARRIDHGIDKNAITGVADHSLVRPFNVIISPSSQVGAVT